MATPRTRVKAASILAALCAATTLLAAAPGGLVSAASAQVQERQPVAKLQRMRVPLNSSQTIRLDFPFTDVLVGSSEIADVIPLSDQTLYVLGKKPGTTNVSVLDAQRRVLAVVDVQVSIDPAAIDQNLRASGLTVRGQGEHVVISGTAPDAPAVDRAVQAAGTLVPPERIINNATVASPQQVLLKVRFIEVNRDAGRELGIRHEYLGRTRAARIGRGGTRVDDQGNTIVEDALLGFAAPFASILGRFAGNSRLLDITIDALESKGLVRRLAEPNLVAVSGDTAEFHAGGEIPIPVASQTSGGVPTITVAFKEFGVRLNFTPTVLSNGLINLKLEPEVSDIDPTLAVQTGGGISIPGLTKRRAKTTVELRDGQSFALAGLLQNITERNIEQLPWLGSVPILGALFRSTEYRSRETELVVIITPHLVKPGKPGALIATPLDTTIPSNDVDLFLSGKMELDKPVNPAAVTPMQKWVAETGARLKGPYGHILTAQPAAPAAVAPAVAVPAAGAKPRTVSAKN